MLLRIRRDAHNHMVKHTRRTTQYVEMTIGNRIKTAWINSNRFHKATVTTGTINFRTGNCNLFRR